VLLTVVINGSTVGKLLAFLRMDAVPQEVQNRDAARLLSDRCRRTASLLSDRCRLTAAALGLTVASVTGA